MAGVYQDQRHSCRSVESSVLGVDQRVQVRGPESTGSNQPSDVKSAEKMLAHSEARRDASMEVNRAVGWFLLVTIIGIIVTSGIGLYIAASLKTLSNQMHRVEAEIVEKNL